MATPSLETGRTIRWRSQRWRILGQADGLLRLVGVDSANDGLEVEPLLEIEENSFAEDVPGEFPLEVEATSRPRWRAMHQAYLATMVGGRERLVGLDWGAIAVEPFQLVPLTRAARHATPRLLIADDTGLGKTAEAGLVLRYLAQRHRAGRVLVVTRAAPEPGRWRRELWLKFGMQFDILRDGEDFIRRRRRAPTVNVFAQSPRMIASMTLLARQVFLDEIRQAPAWDVVIIDEAHNVARRGSHRKRLNVLARELSARSADGGLLLLTATPHDGKTESLMSLLSLLDPHIELRDGRVAISSASRLIVRRLKPEVTLSGGRKFQPPEIHVCSTIANASKEEKELDDLLGAYLDYLREREEGFADADERAKAKGCSFLASMLLKRMGSSVAALRATLRRRLGVPPADEDSDADVERVEDDSSDPEDSDVDPTAGQVTPPPEIDAHERELATALLDAAEKVKPGRDAKLQRLSKLLANELAGEAAVVFTEYRDTLRAAKRRLEADGVPFVVFHGGLPDADREAALHRFQHDEDVRVFLSTDAGSEGQNLQHRCRDVVHLDVPWNPNRYAQRNGRIDRYGQDGRPRIWPLVAADKKAGEGRPEFRALEVILEKLTRIESELGSVGPILPALAGDRVRDVLTRSGEKAQQQVEELVDSADANAAAERAIEDLSALTVQNKREIEKATELVSELGTVDDFEGRSRPLLEAAFRGWRDGGEIANVEEGVVEIVVPRRLRGILDRERLPRGTFRRETAVRESEEDRADPAELLSPGHPLVEAVAQALREESMDSAYEHRFDVAADSEPALILTFIVRYGDAEGRTVEERLEAVAVSVDGAASHDAERDLGRLGLDGQPGDLGVEVKPDPSAVKAWQDRYRDLVPPAHEEAERRALDHLDELIEAAEAVHDEEVAALSLWRQDQEKRIDTETIGLSAQISIDAAEAFDERRDELDKAYEERVRSLRDQSTLSLASIDLIGGLLLVSPAPPA